eukprot:CAMPEP_0182428094 /NCGR_PEP_ID=MMETSP1167-20130531/21015_1 /TAXON_ID=2988 /ORGANISM="Mallomonas Sp, Strain CCMP3275" /LENGTH=315 /DNA_ID=CAMNT_0024610765 /DNA_START=172 /DNA_END=1119 /DNA_ORIENTATION=+
MHSSSQKSLDQNGFFSPLLAEKLPWAQSVEASRELTYMDMLKTQLDLIRKLKMEEVPLEDKFTYKTSDKKNARMASLHFKNDRFRKVRMSYFDAGNSVQVFNSLWYPSYEYDSPLLGLDLISIGPSRVMSVCDFQPLHPTQEYSTKHIEHLSPIREKYPDLHGTLSGKIYDDTSFFSKNMLFGRFTDESKIKPVVGPALEEYLNMYVKDVYAATPNFDPKAMAVVRDRQRQYDVYNAEKDPAVGLFDAYFGKEWSQSFVHDFLFGLCNDGHVSKPVHSFELNMDGNVKFGETKSSHGEQATSKPLQQSRRIDVSV